MNKKDNSAALLIPVLHSPLEAGLTDWPPIENSNLLFLSKIQSYHASSMSSADRNSARNEITERHNPSFLPSLLLIGIFPNTISKVFIAALLAGKDAQSADDYICGLLDHVSEYNSLQLKSALETSMTAGVFSEETSTFLLDFASEYVQIQTHSLLRGILVSVAKTELIAKPSVALNDIRTGMFQGKFHKLWEISAKQK